MTSLSQRGPFTYLPKDAEARKGALKLLRNPNWSVKEVCVRYHVSRQSLWRWSRRPEGWDFGDLSHRPKRADPRSCTEAEKKAVLDIKRAHPDESYIEIFGKLRRKGVRQIADDGLAGDRRIRGVQADRGPQEEARRRLPHPRR
jgi:transposase